MTVLDRFSDFYRNREITPFVKAQEAAWIRFLELGLPSKKDEAFRYVRLGDLERFGRAGVSALETSVDDGTLVFRNGKYCDASSNKNGLPKEMIILPLTKAWKTFGNFLQSKITEGIKNEKNPFVLMNSALFDEGLFIYIPPHTQVQVPLQIIYEADSDKVTLLPRLHIFLGKHAKLEVYTRDVSKKNVFHNGVVEITLEENSSLKIRDIVSCTDESYHLRGLRASLKRRSDLEMMMITDGGKSVRFDGEVKLLEEEARATLKGISFLERHRESHLYLRVEHLAAQTYSLQKFKNVLKDHARSSFEGKIVVAPEAQKTQAYQMNPNLLLSDRALAVSRPNLEIFADDVKASHGATCGEIDPEHLFYLKTRGMDEKTAKHLLVLGFCQEIFEEIALPSFYREAISLVSS